MNNTEWQHKFLKAGTEYGMGDLSMMINIVSEILSEERNKVLDELQILVLKHPNTYEGEEELVFRTTLKEISTIIDQLKLK